MSNPTDNSTSSIKAALDSVTGTVQKTFGNLVGSAGDEREGQIKKDKGEIEHDASHATAKVGNLTASSSGAIKKDNSDRTDGSWNQTVGSAKETLGGVIGSEDLKQAGRRQNLEGQEQEARGQVSDFASGVAGRVTGTVGGAVANVTGNKDAQAAYDRQHAEGKTLQRGAEHDIQKQAQAQQ